MSTDVRVAVLSFLDRQPAGTHHSAESIAEHLGLTPQSVNAYLASASNMAEVDVDHHGYVSLNARLRGQIMAPNKQPPTPAPVTGWNSAHKWERGVVLVCSVLFLSVLLYAALSDKDLRDRQFQILKTILALAGAGFAMAIPGFIQVDIRIKENFVLRTLGAIAVFAVIFFFVPAM